MDRPREDAVCRHVAVRWKPDGLTIITPETIQATLEPLPIRKLWGVGPATEKQLAKLNVKTIGQLRAIPLERLTAAFGSSGEHFWRLARGLDDRPVTPDSQAKSIGQEITFARDLADREELLAVLFGQVEQVARRCRKHRLKARTVNVKIRYGDFETINRSKTLAGPTDLTDELWSVAKGLFNAWADARFKPVRLIGVAAESLQASGVGQAFLFEDPQRQKRDRLDRTVDDIVQRFGRGSIGRGGATRRETETEEDR